MLFFKKLHLVGFKSFVDTTELAIEPGLTGIVGPNGCGKSNLVEALRWVMGETSAKRMRGGAMDDVIFNGSVDRPSRNLAEVRLEVDNTARRAPAIFNEFDDIEISRKIERDKGSTYRVNGKENRARDIQLLFADAGSGAQSAALVGQGRIGAVIGAKPTERRVLLEEAAGIAGLYNRRHEAELRLRAAETNLTRLDDIMETLNSQLRSLARQAKQAERYREMNAELRRLEAALFYLEITKLNVELEEAKSGLRDGERLVGEKMATVAHNNRIALDSQKGLTDLRNEDAQKAAGLQRLKLEQEKLEAEQSRIADQLNQAREGERQTAGDTARESALVEEATATMARLDDEQRSLAESASRDDALSGSLDEDFEAAQTRYRLAAEKIEKLTQERASGIAAKQSATTSLQTLTQQNNTLAQQAAQADENRLRLEGELEALGGEGDRDELPALEESLEALVAEVGSAENQREEAEIVENNASTQLRQAMAERQRCEAEISGINASLATLSEDEADQSPILDSINVEAGYEACLAAALGDDLTAAETNSASRGWGSSPQAFNQASFAATLPTLDQFVTAPAVLTARLQRIGVVESADQAKGVALQPGERLVSKAGDLWRWDGYFCTADDNHKEHAAAVVLTQRNRLVALNDEFEGLKSRADTAENEQQTAKQALADLDARLVDLRAQRTDNEQTIRQKRDKLAETQEQFSRLSGQIEASKQTKVTVDQQIADLGLAIVDVEQQIASVALDPTLDDTIEKARSETETARAALSEVENRRQHHINSSKARANRLRAIDSDVELWSVRKDNAQSRLSELSQRAADLENRVTELAAAPSTMVESLTALGIKIAEADSMKKLSSDRLAEAETASLNAAKEERDAERTLAQTREDLIRAEGKVTQIEERLNDANGRLKERLAVEVNRLLDIAEIENPELLPDIDEAENKRRSLLQKREAIGPVNLRAEQETEEIRSELVRYETDREDVQLAIQALRSGIAELNSEGRQKLTAAFDAVNGHFSDLFKRLFGGGNARLELVDSEDPLDAGLQIYASPPGKKMQMLTLLSGGEQALTATALIFAVFLTKPAPLCVLDEVDAPLDDENNIRFCELVRFLAEETKTRFLMVTHSPQTMARVDRLYGVTMAEKGVSTLMSVNLKTATDYVAA